MSEIIEPDKKFQGKLIDRWDDIGVMLYTRVSEVITVRKAMMSFISRLPNKERSTTLKEVYDALKEGRVDCGSSVIHTNDKKDFESYMQIHGIVSDYLGETYFKNYRVARPQEGDQLLELPKGAEDENHDETAQESEDM